MSTAKRIIVGISVYYLLLAIKVVLSFGAISNNFPTRNLTTVFLIALSICLILYYSHHVLPNTKVSLMMKLLAWMAFFLMVLRGIKYSAFSQVDILARYSWYLYYAPILLIPLFLFYIAIVVAPKNSGKSTKLWFVLLAITSVLILLVLTNDIHQQVFKFKDNFENWNSDYSHGWLFYVVYVWQFLLYIVATVILLIKCRISGSKKYMWFVLIPVLLGIVMYVLLLTDTMPKINGSAIMEFPEAHIFTIVVALECYIQIGLIPTNNEYKKIFQNLSINTQITDKNGKTIYASKSAIPLINEQFQLISGSRIEEHIILNKMELPGGYGFWQNDISELDRLNDELNEVKEGLEQEAELTRLQNEYREKEVKIKERTALYDIIAKSTQKQSQAIFNLAQEARKSHNKQLKDEHRRHITLLGSYIKRYANLTILAQENENIEVGELGLSIAEVLRYLNICNIPGEFVGDTGALIKADSALTIFKSLDDIINNNYQSLKGVFISLTISDDITIKLMIENLTNSLSKEVLKELKDNGVSLNIKEEDNVTYIVLKTRKGEKSDD